jgi:hypothetical protein
MQAWQGQTHARRSAMHVMGWIFRAFRPFHPMVGPLWEPSSNHPLCGWYMIS